ncbi:Y4bD/Y4pK family protein [Mesorhizobium sp. M1217]
MLSTRKQNWGEDRVMFYDAEGRLRSLLASWTDVGEPDVSFRSRPVGRPCVQMIWQPWRL